MKLQPLFQREFSAGQITNLNVNLMPENAVDLGLNVDFDEEIGSAVSRLGTAIVGTQMVDGNSVLGLWQHIDTDTAANNKLFAATNASGGATSVIYDVNDVAGGAVVTGLTASKKVRFLTYGGSTLAINGADGERAWNGSSWITTGGVFDLGDFPGSNSCELVIEFLDRVYTAGDSTNPSRLHYSSVFTGGAFAWDGDFVDIEAEDAGGPITALAKVPGYVLVFKERSLHRWNFFSAFPESLVQIGTPSQESVVMGGGLCAFYSNSNENEKGFYITNGGRPVPISHDSTRPIKKWVDAISSASEANIAGWATDKIFAWSVGDLTIDGQAYTNVVLRYNRILNQWSVRTYPTQFTVFAKYLLSGVNTVIGGDDDGQVLRIDKPATYSDYPSTTAIQWKVRTKHDTYGYNQKKSVSDRAIVRGKGIEGTSLALVVDEVYDKKIPLKPPTVLSNLLGVFGLGKVAEGTSIAVEVSGATTGARAYVREIELPDVDVRQNYD